MEDSQQSSTPNQPTPVTPPGSVAAPTRAKSAKVGVFVSCFLVVVLAVTAAAMAMSNNKAQKEITDLRSQLSAAQAHTHPIPEGAVKVSDCIPNMGSHYITKDSHPQYGPFLLVNKQNQVIGVEYMASEDMYDPIPGVTPPVKILTKASPLYGWKFDHAELSHTPEGHEGFLEDHIDVHLYTVSQEERKNVCL